MVGPLLGFVRPAGFDEQRQRIGQAGLELAPGELLAAATGRGAQLEGITAVLLLTDEDDFNALGSTVLQGSDGRLAPVTRSGPPEPEPGDSMVVLTARPPDHAFIPRVRPPSPGASKIGT